MSQITVKAPSPRAALRALKQPLYDCMEAPAAAAAVNNLTWFQTPIGGALNVTGVAKSVAETNLTQSGQLGVPQEFDLYGFNFTFVEDDGYLDTAGAPTSLANFALDIIEVYEASVFKFFFGQQRPWLTVPLSRIPHGTFFLTGPGDDMIATENFFAVSMGDSSKKEFYKFLANDAQIGIHSAENFSARVEWPLAAFGLTADGAASRMFCYLVGVLYTAL